MAIKLGDITFGLGADTKGLQNAVDKLKTFQKLVDSTARSQVQGTQQTVKAYQAQEASIRRALQASLNLNAAVRRAGGDTQLIANNTKAFQRLTNSLTSGEATMVQLSRANDLYTASINKSRRALAEFIQQQKQQKEEKFDKVLRDIQSAAVLAVGPLSGLGARITALIAISQRSSFALAGLVLGVTGTVTAMSALGTAAVNTALAVQQIHSALTVATGTSVGAEVEFKNAAQTADKYGQEIKNTTIEYSKFAAATANSGISLKSTRQAFEGILAASSSLHLGTSQVQDALLALTQIASKGTLQMQELHQQLGNALPGALKLAADAMHVTISQLFEMTSQGKILSKEFIEKFGQQLLLVFGQQGVAASNQLQGSMNKLNNSIFLFNEALDNSVGFSDKFKSGLDALSGLIRNVTKNMGDYIAAIGTFGSALAIAFAPALLRGIASAASGLVKVAGGITAINAAMAANPFTGILVIAAKLATIILGTAAAYLYFSDTSNAVTRSNRDLVKSTEEFISQSQKQGGAIKEIADEQIKTIQDKIKAQQEYIKSLQNPGTTDKVRNYGKQLLGDVGNLFGGEIKAPTGLDEESLKKAKAQLLDFQQALFGLLELMRKGPGDDNNTSKAFEQAKVKVDALIAKAKVFQNEMKSIQSGHGVEGVSGEKALGVAQNALKNVTDTKELQKMVEYLHSLGIEGNDAAQALANFIKSGYDAQKFVQDFTTRAKEQPKILDEFNNKIKEMTNELAALSAGPDAYKKFTISKANNSAIDEFVRRFHESSNLTQKDIDELVAKFVKLQTAIDSKKAYNTVLDNINKLVIKTKAAKDQLDALQSGQGTAAGKISEDIGKAREMLRGLDPEQLNAVQKYLEAVGIKGASAVDALGQLETQLRTTTDASKKFDENLKNTPDILENYRRKIEQARKELAAMQKGPAAYAEFQFGKKQEDEIAKMQKDLARTNRPVQEQQDMINTYKELKKQIDDTRPHLLHMREVATEVSHAINQGFDDLGKGIADAFVNGGNAAKSFQDILKSVETAIIQTLLQIALIDNLKSTVSGLAHDFFGTPLPAKSSIGAGGSNFQYNTSAPMFENAFHGKAFGRGGRLLPFAQGGVTNTPTFFPVSGGNMGVMSEFGQNEGIFPLHRDAAGNLGVKATMSAPVTNVIINNNTDAQAKTKRQKNGTGGEDILVTLDRMVSQVITAGGKTTSALNKGFNLRPSVTPR